MTLDKKFACIGYM